MWTPCVRDAAEIFIKQTIKIPRFLRLYILAVHCVSKSKPDLNLYRYKSFIKAVGKNNRIKLASLPPITVADMEHFKKVISNLRPGRVMFIAEWRWKHFNYLTPITMNKHPDPENLLQMIFCGCKKECGAACGCRKKAGLYCTPAYAVCNSQNCLNCSPCPKL